MRTPPSTLSQERRREGNGCPRTASTLFAFCSSTIFGSTEFAGQYL